MTTQRQDDLDGANAHEDDPCVSRRRLLRRGAIGAGIAVAGGALVAPRAAEANDGDAMLAGTTVSGLTAETGLSGDCSPSVLRLAQGSASGHGLVVQMNDSGATGTGVAVTQAGAAPAITAVNSGTNPAAAITATGTASLAANTGVVQVTNSSTVTTGYCVRAISTATGGAMFAQASTAPAITAQSTGSGAALVAKNTGTGPGVSVTTTNNGAALLLTSGGTAILASSGFTGTPAGVADKAGISITTQTSTGSYVKSASGRAVHAETASGNDTVYASNGSNGPYHTLTGYMSNASSTTSSIYGSTAGSGAGIEGKSNLGRGGQFTGKLAQIRLLPSTGAHPASGSRGDLFVDNAGSLFFCKGGTTWIKLA